MIDKDPLCAEAATVMHANMQVAKNAATLRCTNLRQQSLFAVQIFSISGGSQDPPKQD